MCMWRACRINRCVNARGFRTSACTHVLERLYAYRPCFVGMKSARDAVPTRPAGPYHPFEELAPHRALIISGCHRAGIQSPEWISPGPIPYRISARTRSLSAEPSFFSNNQLTKKKPLPLPPVYKPERIQSKSGRRRQRRART